MPIDVQTEIESPAPQRGGGLRIGPGQRDDVVREHQAVEWKSSKPVAVGSRIGFVAQFLGRRLAYTYEVTEMVPGERFVMSTAEGPFPMETTYTWEDTPNGGTKMTLRNLGEPSGFSRVAAPIMVSAMRRANRKDLIRLKEILEASTSS